MKLLMIVVDEACKEEIEVVLSRAGVRGFTEIPKAVGMGTTGPRLGSAAFPKTSAIVFTLLEDDEVGRVRDAVRSECPTARHAHLITWSVETLGA